VMSVLMKLAGGTPSLAHELNVDAFLGQARSYDQATSSPMGWMLRNAQVGCPANHPPRTPCTASLTGVTHAHTSICTAAGSPPVAMLSKTSSKFGIS
jgi:hypothetical protein